MFPFMTSSKTKLKVVTKQAAKKNKNAWNRYLPAGCFTSCLACFPSGNVHRRKKTDFIPCSAVPWQDGDQHCGNTDKVSFSLDAGLCRKEQSLSCLNRADVAEPASEGTPVWKNKQICWHVTPGVLCGCTRVDALNGILMFRNHRGTPPQHTHTQTDARRGFTPPPPQPLLGGMDGKQLLRSH